LEAAVDLAELQSRGLLELLDVELARALSRMGSGSSFEVELAIALTSRNVRRGHACFSIRTRSSDLWSQDVASGDVLPAPARWEEALRQSPLTRGGPLVLDDRGRLYLRRYWQLEEDIAGELAARSDRPPIMTKDSMWLQLTLDRLFPGEPDAPQRRAAQNALQHRVSLLCGGPGTGKTTTVAGIVALFVERGLRETGSTPKVMLLAPTGKSAARLAEAVSRAKAWIPASDEALNGIPDRATTIHRALGMGREGMHFRRSAEFPLEADMIVVDEASMVDLALMRQLLDATPRDATLLIVGDPDQLTSVEAGSVLRDLVTASSKTWWRDRVTQLSRTYRYDQTKPLGQLLEAIRNGSLAGVDAVLSRRDAEDVAWASLDALPLELDRAADHWVDVLSAHDPAKHFELRERHAILTPFRSGPIGTRRLGAAIQERLRRGRGGGPRVTPLIIEENSYELSVYNGDPAMLIDGDPPMATIGAVSGGFREIAEARLPRYSEAFALSVHKAQGSEFDEVLIVLPERDAPLLTRELLYTAVSRARKRARIVGPKEVAKASLERRTQRYSGLVDAIARRSH
jgi:exodeoxyribonuclease V alpha subunit